MVYLKLTYCDEIFGIEVIQTIAQLRKQKKS